MTEESGAANVVAGNSRPRPDCHDAELIMEACRSICVVIRPYEFGRDERRQLMSILEIAFKLER